MRHRKPSDIYLNVHDRSWVSGDVFRAIFLLLYIIGALWILMKKIVNVRIQYRCLWFEHNIMFLYE